MIAIGMPGATPRLQLRCSLDKVAGHLAQGEVALEVAGAGDYLIAADGKSIGPRPMSIEERRATLWASIKRMRTQAEAGGCSTPTGIVQTDAASVARIGAAALDAAIAQAAGQPYTIIWTMADNTAVRLDAAGMIAIGTAVGRHMADCHDHSQELRARIASADADALASLDINAGWPA